jgi:hypothetical protein
MKIKTMRKASVIILAILCWSTSSFSQLNPPEGNLKFNSFPIPPTPNASALGKFTDMPVSKSTGIPQISIPVYSYADNNKNLGLSVSISYHAGGHKVEDMASNVGLGWALNAGGVISRTMNGLPDETLDYGYLNTANLKQYNTDAFNHEYSGWNPTLGPQKGVTIYNTNTQDFDWMRNYGGNGKEDTKADIFSVSCGDINTKFFFDKTGKIIYTGVQNLKITYTPLSHSPSFTSFTITDSKGTKYVFDVQDVILSDDEMEPSYATPAFVSSWYLSKIESYDGVDKILFTYTRPNSLLTYPSLMYRSGFSKSWATNLNLPIQTVYTEKNSITHSNEGAPNISQITLPDNTVLNFEYALNRLDYVGDKALTAITINNNGSRKKIKLNYGYFEADYCANISNGCVPGRAYPPNGNDEYKRLKLLSVQEVGNDGTENPPYEFDYYAKKLPVRNSKQQDWWGFYSTTPQTVPPTNSGFYNYPPPNWVNLGVNNTPATLTRDPNQEDCKAWVLKRITYPAGGSSLYDYELNDAVLYGTTTNLAIGGLRVKQVKNFSGYNNYFEVVNYAYKTNNGISSGKLLVSPSYHTYVKNSSVKVQNGVINGVIAILPSMFERLEPSHTLSAFGGSPVMYAQVTETRASSLGYTGKTVYEFNIPTTMNQWDNIYPFINKQLYEWTVGLPTITTIYNSANTIIKKTETEYNIINDEFLPVLLGYTSTPQRDVRRNLSTELLSSTNQWYPGTNINPNLYGAREYFLAAGRALLKKQTDTEWDAAGTPLSNVTDVFYDAQYDLINKVVKTANNRQVEARVYYPFDYTTAGLPYRDDLVNANRINNVIATESWMLKSNQYSFTSGNVFNYGTFNSVLRESSNLSTSLAQPLPQGAIGNMNPNNLVRHSSYKNTGTVTAYDAAGRITEVELKAGQKKAFIWGKSRAYPVFSADNANYNDVAYTSFEANEDNSNFDLTYNVVPLINSMALTGSQSCQLNGLSIYKNNLNAYKNYFVTYWSQGIALAVSGTQSGWPKLLYTKTINGNTWTCYQHLVSGNTSIYISGGGAGAIDELRVHPANAIAVSNTYNSLVGIKTGNDVNNNITYYEYDNFNRLKLIRDINGKIIKVIEYAYNVNNSKIYYSKPLTQDFLKSDCPSGYNGSLVYFSVPEAMFTSFVDQADADLLAHNYLLANGPAYANANGTCTLANPCGPCSGQDKKCIGTTCETGIKIYTSSVYNPVTGYYDCTYHYEWGDGSWSPNYVEQSAGECVLF